MRNARYVNIIKVAFLKWLVIHVLVANDFKYVQLKSEVYIHLGWSL